MSSAKQNRIKTKVVDPIRDVVTGRFLLSKHWTRNWPFILFLSFLALVMIASSHSAERKVHEIARLKTNMKELNSQHIDLRSQLMIESMEYKVVERAKEAGLVQSKEPPFIIKAEDE